MLIKDFLNNRDTCFCCKQKLLLRIDGSPIEPAPFSFQNDILHINFPFNIIIDTSNNSVLSEKLKSYKQIQMSLCCPTHNEWFYRYYSYNVIFDIYNNGIMNVIPAEYLAYEDFAIYSHPLVNIIEYTNLINNKTIELPYFDYSKMSLSKLRDKLKTYLLLQ